MQRPEHALPHPPQFCGSLCSSTQALLHAVVPPVHWIPHDVPSHVAMPSLGTGHTVQEAPHDVVDDGSTQAPPQSMNPALQLQAHVPVHTLVAFAGGCGQAVHEAPQLRTEVSDWHDPRQ
jgi:hypothetical protein